MNHDVLFALKTKEQGDAQDSRVLTWSRGALSVKDYEGIFNRLAVGSMPERTPPTAELPPWITCGTHEIGGTVYVVIVRQEWTERRDANDRAISMSTCICIPYSDVASSRTSFVSLYNSIPPYQQLESSNAPLQIQLERLGQSSEISAGLIDDLGFDFCAGVAASLLGGTVALLKGGKLTQQERLVYLEAIAGLLPYGSRAELSISTWVQAATRHRIRLGFSDAARPEQARVEWGRLPAAALRPGSIAHEYYSMLLDIGMRRGTLRVMEHLSKQREAHSFQQPDVFLRELRALDRPYLAWKAANDGRGDLDEVRAIFLDGTAGELGWERQRFLLVSLLNGPQLTQLDIEIIRSNWKADLLPALQASGRSLLRRPEALPTLDALGDVAAEKSILGHFVYGLLEHAAKRSSTGAEVGAQRAAIRLLLHRWQQIDQEAQPGGPGHGRIHSLLLQHRWLLYEVVIEARRRWANTVELMEMLDWLGEGSPKIEQDLQVFRIVLGSLEQVAHKDMVASIGECGFRYIRELINIAVAQRQSGALERVLPAVVAWLSGRPRSDQQEWSCMLADLGTLSGLSPEVEATIDLGFLSLGSGSSPTFLHRQLDRSWEECKPYVESLFAQLFALDSAARSLVVDSLADTRCATPTCAQNLLYLFAHYLSHDPDLRVDELYKSASRLIEQHPHALRDGPLIEYWKPVLMEHGYAVEFLLTEFRTRFSRSTSIGEAAHWCAEIIENAAWEKKNTPAALNAIVRILDDTHYFREARDIREFQKLVRADLGKRTLPPRYETDIDFRLTQSVLSGTLAPHLRDEYRGSVTSEALDGVEDSFKLASELLDYFHVDDLAQLDGLLKSMQKKIKLKQKTRG